ncbi:MAG: transporter substrate-binding domain-containing protein [Rhodospirillaceae bacterium]|nr:transporter substrate-binding domain-containing protein [Rhodospirillaceae bacterium]
MKKINFLIITFAVAVFMTIGAPLRAEETVVKVSSDPWEPWVMGTEGEVASGGIAVDLVTEIFRRIGVKSETVIYPYERCMIQMKTGERDVLLMVKKTPEREEFMLFSDVAATDPQLLYYSTERMDGFEWNEFADLKPYTVGGVQAFNYGDLTQATNAGQVKMELTANDSQNIKKLFAGRIDLIVLNRSTANNYIQQHPEAKGKLKATAKIISNAEFHFGLSKKGSATGYLSQINATISDMKKDGSLNKILGLN